MSFWLYPADTDLVDVVHPHIEHGVDFVIAAAGNVAQEIVAEHDGDGLRIVLVLPVQNEVQLGTDLQVVEYLDALVILETGNVEIKIRKSGEVSNISRADCTKKILEMLSDL